jgi:TonB family protein
MTENLLNARISGFRTLAGLALVIASAAVATPALAQDSGATAEAGSAATAEPRLLNAVAITRRVANAFPAQMLDMGIPGRATLELTVSSDGKVQDATLLNASEAPFGEVALSIARYLRFEPARASGVAVNTRVSVPVVVNISGE